MANTNPPILGTSVVDRDETRLGLLPDPSNTGNVRSLVNLAPNIQLLDTSAGAGVAQTAFLAYTVKGGSMRALSAIRILANISWVGGNGKSTFIKIGQAGGTLATATQVSGQSGLTNQVWTPMAAVIGNDGVLTRQVSTPANATNLFGTSAASTGTVTSIDTSMDWVIYIGIQFSVLNGGNSATLVRLMLEQVD